MPFRFPLARTPAQVTPRATPPTSSPLISSLSSALPKGRLRSLLTALILAAFSTNIFFLLRLAICRRAPRDGAFVRMRINTAAAGRPGDEQN